MFLQCTETFYKQCVEEEMRLVSKASAGVKKKTVEALKTNLKEDEEGLDSDDETDLSDRLAGVDLEDSDQGLFLSNCNLFSKNFVVSTMLADFT